MVTTIVTLITCRYSLALGPGPCIGQPRERPELVPGGNEVPLG